MNMNLSMFIQSFSFPINSLRIKHTDDEYSVIRMDFGTGNDSISYMDICICVYT